MKLIFSCVLLAIACSVASCGSGGGGGGGGPPETDVTGTWTGSWASSNGINSGAINATLSQNGSAISGSATFSGSPCFGGGAISGSIGGVNVDVTLSAGGISVDLSTTVSGVAFDDMNGTYDVESAGACTGDTGTITLTRVAPLAFEDDPRPSIEGFLLLYDTEGNQIGIGTVRQALPEASPATAPQAK